MCAVDLYFFVVCSVGVVEKLVFFWNCGENVITLC